jgi:hypothetical protein
LTGFASATILLDSSSGGRGSVVVSTTTVLELSRLAEILEIAVVRMNPM